MRLERRYWKIDSLNDHIDEVDGPGIALYTLNNSV